MIYVNGRPVEFGRYPNGEVVVPVLDREAHAVVRLHWESDQDLVNLMFVRELLDPKSSSNQQPPSLFIDYMPYSRMDRAQDGRCFSLKHVCDYLSHLAWRTIAVVEPHSSETTRLMRVIGQGGARPVWATAKLIPNVMNRMVFQSDRDCIVLPDRGAYERYIELAADVFEKTDLVVMKKRRDFETGRILGLEVDYRVIRGPLPQQPGGTALIIDDLCSRGGTFIEAAKHLREYLGYSAVNLLVTHMEDAGLTGGLSAAMNHVYCTDTMSWTHDLPANFHVFDRNEWL